MGCCVSTEGKSKIPKQNSLKNNPHEFPCVSKSPPRAEEEAVKEVLSETPKPKPNPSSRPESPTRRVREEEEEEEEDDGPMKPKILLLTPKKAFPERKVPIKYPGPSIPEEISEVSEMSESISTTTLKEEEDQRQLLSSNATSTTTSRAYRSQRYNGNFHNKYNNNFHQQQQNLRNQQGRSPARKRPDPSPPRKRYPGLGGPRRELVGDNSGQRSQSPGARANVGRSLSAMRNGPSPGRVRIVDGPENVKKVEKEKEEEEESVVRKDSEEWDGPKESLENPLVSLECFIFL